MKKLLMLIVTAAITLTGTYAFAEIAGTQHDYIGKSAYGRCGVCHVPHAALGANRLWRAAQKVVTGTVWGGTNVAQLCATCHSGGATMAAENAPNNKTPNPASSAWDDTSHQGDWAVLNTAVTGLNPGQGAVAGKPYTGSGQMECTSCHNVHYNGDIATDKTARPFLRPGAANTMSSFCADCHSDRLSTAKTGTNHVVKAYADSNVPADEIYLQDPPNTALTKPVTLGNWTLGGKFEIGADGIVDDPVVGTDSISCISCHAIHNPPTTTANENQALHLLAIDNTGLSAGLCQGCHGGKDTAGANTANGVGGAIATNGDHPHNVVIGAASNMTIDEWYADADIDNTRVERYDADADANWPRGTANGTTFNKIICTSCHSAHKARTGDNLKRTVGHATDFCKSCHSSVSPMAHHSNITNDTDALSNVDCDDCHEATQVSAHNGFGYGLNPILLPADKNNNNSELCMSCHYNVGVVDFPPAAATALRDPVHDTTVGNFADNLGVAAVNQNMKSHYIGTFSNDVAKGINVKTGRWNDKGAGFGGFSKYGGGGTGSTTDAGTNLVCESCHSVLHNAGRYIASPTLTSGWEVNLLLQNYTDDSSTDLTIGSGLCVGCHNQSNDATYKTGSVDGLVNHSVVKYKAITPPNMHPMSGWDITRAIDAGYVSGGTATLKTNNVTRTTYANTAEAVAAGGGGKFASSNASYPALNQMDCDSCHRPHRAPVNSTFDQTQTKGAGVVVPVILEVQAAANEYADLCQTCHAY